MQRRTLVCCAAAALAAVTFGSALPATAAEDYRLSGPYAHENLAIYLVHGPGRAGPVPLSLEEALKAGKVRVHETGDVNALAIENLGKKEIFVQAGDIVKGGQQDRVLTVSLILPPRSGQVAIGSFCVEQGRWSARGQEKVHEFESAASALPSREAKLAMKAPRKSHGTAAASQSADTGDRQQKIWESVAVIQEKLTDSLGASVAAEPSPSSLQLALENKELEDARGAYVEALLPLAEKESDVIGYAFAINGEVNSADVYPSNALFLKLWPKLLQASAVEAIGEKQDGDPAPPPSNDRVRAFLAAAESGDAAREKLTRNAELEIREADSAFLFEARTEAGDWMHRNYLAK